MDAQNLINAAKGTLDDNGDHLYFQTLLPFVSYLTPKDQLKYRIS